MKHAPCFELFNFFSYITLNLFKYILLFILTFIYLISITFVSEDVKNYYIFANTILTTTATTQTWKKTNNLDKSDIIT